jgi:glycerol-3-phosphate dehydrogenase (NAD(P)+)
MVADRENARYLPGIKFPPNLEACPDLGDCLEGVRDLLVVVPSHGLRDTLTKALPFLGPDSRVCWATKGFELHSGKLPHQVAAEVLGEERPVAVLSGPTFAKEVAEGLPTAMTIASNDDDFGQALATAISGKNFRAYTTDDFIGVEVGGAIKNVLAIGAGMCDGLGFGANARIALITRGLVELTRLGVALGAKNETMMGLAGMGDLVLTCTGDLSRNRQVGLKLGQGQKIKQIVDEMEMVAEGVKTTKSAYNLARREGVDMPILEQVYRVIYEDMDCGEAVKTLLARSLKEEIEF